MYAAPTLWAMLYAHGACAGLKRLRNADIKLSNPETVRVEHL